MRDLVKALASLAALAAASGIVSLSGCASEAPAASDVCGEAKNRFSSCGTSLPLLSDGPCSGTTRIVARCVVDHAHDCDELSTLFVRLDACVADMLDGGDSLLPPATDLPVPGRDGGTIHDAGQDAGPAPPRDAGRDASTVDASMDSGPSVHVGNRAGAMTSTFTLEGRP